MEAIRRAMAERLKLDPVGGAPSPAGAIALAAELQPDLVVVSQRLTHPEEVASCRAMRSASPASRLVVLTPYAAERDWLLALVAGASACVLFEVRMLSTLADVLNRVLAGENLIHSERGESLARLAQPAGTLASEKHQQVLAQLFQLKTDAQIAAELRLSQDEVARCVGEVASLLMPSGRTA
jgi:DNA-binding NarL/FixJ family response regulator